MTRLITFGASAVYGIGLPDCPYGSTAPSKFAWPQLLANKLGYECLNLSKPGIGNFEILINLFKTNLAVNDIVVLAFSYFQRYDAYRMIDKLGNGETIARTSVEYKKLIKTSFLSDHYDDKNYWDNWLAIQHCELYLKNKNIKNISFQNIEESFKHTKPNTLIQLENYWEEGSFVKIDQATDHLHAGVISHKTQADKIYEKLGKMSLVNLAHI
jgi:hypothetical protein